MQIGEEANAHEWADPGAKPDLKEVVMGLHWTPPDAGAATEPADLDAMCVLFDADRRVLEVVSAIHPRNADSSVIHTGDSRTGTSEWDDERIFVFLDALPEAISSVAFVVISATGRVFSEVRGASCHVSDHVTEQEWIRLQLTELGQRTAHCVATLQRGPAGWRLSREPEAVNAELMAALLSSIARGKGSAVQ